MAEILDEREFEKFDKETWLYFIKYQFPLDKSLFDCLSTIQRSVKIDKLIKRNKEINERLREMGNDGSYPDEYLSLLKKGMRIDKKLNKLFKEIK